MSTLSFTTYSLYSEHLEIQTGLFNRSIKEIQLYRILDVSLTQSLLQRLFQLGSLKIITADDTASPLFIRDICYPEDVHRLICDMLEVQHKVAIEFFE